MKTKNKKVGSREVNTERQQSSKISGSLDSLSTLQITADMKGLDAESKAILHSKEVLSVILQETVEEFKGYSVEEIIDFIETDSITETKEVSTGRTNSLIRGEQTEFVQLNEKTSGFDIMFQAKNPRLSQGKVIISLHIDVESQKTYRPGYPIEKRGTYYLARSLSSQLSLITDTTDYNKLEKCYSIWICRDDIPTSEQYSVSFYKMTNTCNVGNFVSNSKDDKEKDYDLLELVIIRLGNKTYQGKEGDEGFRLLRFLNAVMYPHRQDFMETISEYIDFSNNAELWKETKRMDGLGQSIFEELTEEGIQNAVEIIQELGQNKECAGNMIMRKYELSEEEAKIKIEKYWKA